MLIVDIAGAVTGIASSAVAKTNEIDFRVVIANSMPPLFEELLPPNPLIDLICDDTVGLYVVKIFPTSSALF
jgi:hypothetical protein